MNLDTMIYFDFDLILQRDNVVVGEYFNWMRMKFENNVLQTNNYKYYMHIYVYIN